MGRKVIHTILNLRDNMSGGMVKAAKKVKGVNKEMLAATRTVERFQRKTADACSRAVGSLGKLGLAAGGAAAALGIKTGHPDGGAVPAENGGRLLPGGGLPGQAGAGRRGRGGGPGDQDRPV